MDNKTVAHIICESTAKEIEFKPIKESSNGFIIAEGILQEADQENRNHRLYSRKDLYDQIYDPRQQELVVSGNFKGEAGHPMDTALSRQQTIEPKYTQVWYTKLWMEGQFVKAQFRGTNNEYGKEFNQDLMDGQRPSFSLRALGRISNENGKAYVRGLKIVTYDRVYFPSHKTAYTERLISESTTELDIGDNKSILVPKGNRMVIGESSQSFIAPITNSAIRSYLVEESANLNFIRNNFDTLYQSIILSEDGNSVLLTDVDHNTIVVPIERHIQNELMGFCSSI